jgi:mRNA-degrading endonuclease YafQ of YafQ-DinJ toxin-antitoxin module
MQKSNQENIKKILENNPVDRPLFDQAIKRLLETPPSPKRKKSHPQKSDKTPSP